MADPRAEYIGKVYPQPACTFPVSIDHVGNSAYFARIARTRELRIPMDACAKPAEYTFDGKPRCRQHAGDDALTVALGDRP